MAIRLLLAPSAAGKTQTCLARLRVVLQDQPLTPAWVIVPDRNQAVAFRQRLAAQGGALGAHVGTFGDLYTEILALAGESLPTAPEPVIHRVLRSAIDTLAQQAALPHYLPIQHRPGFVRALSDFIAELKRARIEPPQFSAAVRGHGRRLEELAALYDAYQAALIRLDWADPEGLGWLAVLALQKYPTLLTDWRLLIVDGFDSFNPTQLETLKLLANQVGEVCLTLSGETDMRRVAHRRFARTLQAVQAALSPVVETLPACSTCTPALAYLGAKLFEGGSAPRSAEARITFLEAQTMTLEAREALRWLKAHIVRDGVKPEQCAVIARDLGPYQAFLREAAHEFGLPVYCAGGESLSRNPAIAAVLNLLELPLQNWARRPLLDTLRTPYFDRVAYGLSPTDAARLDEVARWGQVTEGLAQWEETLTRLAGQAEPISNATDISGEEIRPPQPPVGGAAQDLWRNLAAFARRITPPAQGDTALFVTWIEDLLQDDLKLQTQIEVQADTAARDLSALAAFREVLRALVLSDKILGRSAALAYTDFYLDLRGAIDAAAYKFADEQAPRAGSIYAANMTAARGVSYRAVAVLGLSEGLFPAPLTEDPFLSDEEREALRQTGLPLEPRLRSDQQTLFYEAVTRATDYLLLTRPYLADDGEIWEPSPYWMAALELFDTKPQHLRADDVRPHSEAASPDELLVGAVRARALPAKYAELAPVWTDLQFASAVLRARQAVQSAGPYEGDATNLAAALSTVYEPAHIWSASRLETYGACGFSFFIKNALGLEIREAPEPGYDAAQLGSMLHAILERVYRDVPDPLEAEALVAALPAAAQSVFGAAPAEYGFRPNALWDVQRAELQQALETTLRKLAQASAGFRPVRCEVKFGFDDVPTLALDTAAGLVKLHGVIDRVDQDEAQQVRIIDYKTGSSGLAASDFIEGRRLQLALYALAAEKALGLGRPVDGFYWKIRKGEAGSLRLEKFAHTTPDGQTYVGAGGAMALVTAHIGTFVQSIRAGKFAPVTPRGDCSPYCPAQLFCWRYKPARY